MSGNDANEQAAHINNLQESFSKQQKKISALKELVRKSEVAHGKSTSSAQEKVKNIAQRLTHLKIKARSRQNAPATTQQNESLVESSTREPVLLSPSQTQTQSPQYQHSQPPQFSHSFSQVEHSIGSTSHFMPLKPQHRSDSSKSLSHIATPGSEKILLLRQQMEQNKLLMAQRASSKQHLEQLVTQLKEKFDSTQQCLEDTNELGKSMSDLSALMMHSPVTRERHKSATDLSSQPFSLEKERIKFLENRCRLLEKQLEKQRQLHGEHEVSSVSESTSLKRVKELENKVLELEKTLQTQREEVESKVAEVLLKTEEIRDIRSSVAAKDEEIFMLRLKQGERANEFNELTDEESEIENLLKELAVKQARITELEEINDMLETTRCDLTMKNNAFEEQVQQLNTDLEESSKKLFQLQEELQGSESKCVSLEEVLEKLQNTTEAVIVEPKLEISTNYQVNAEMAKQIQELQDENLQLKEENRQLKVTISNCEKLEVTDVKIAEKIAALEATIEGQREDLKERMTTINRMEEELMEKTIELNVLNANFKVLEEKLEVSSKSKSLFSSSGTDVVENSELEAEVQQLKQKLDESNKAMIKLKLKCKQSEKQIEKLKKGSDLNGEIVRLEKLNEELQQKVIELEDEKGQWQLTQVECNSKMSESSDEKEKILELENVCKTQKETIRLLEEQKYEQAQKLEATEESLKVLEQKIDNWDKEETARVKSEISEVHLEEQVEEQAQQIKNLEETLSKVNIEAEEYKEKMNDLKEQKQIVDKKLENYIVENMELLDKIEKLSKSSSSAESIEIVERLTQQERAEIDEFNKLLGEHVVSSVNELTQTELGPELSDSLVKLREESSELMNKIELFTAERREVLERMEILTAENHDLINKIEDLTHEKEEMETNALLANDAKIKLEEKLEELLREKDALSLQVADFKAQGTQLSQELASLQKSSEVVAALDSKEDASLFEKCEKSLSNLNTEIESYRKAGDKNAKFNVSKKLVKEAKNAHAQLSELLQKVKEASTAVETVTVVETVVAVTAPNGKALAEYEQLTAQNRELKATIEELRRSMEESREAEMDITVPQTIAVPALTDDKSEKEKRDRLTDELKKSEELCIELQSTVENMRLELMQARTADEERTLEVSQINEELESLRQASQDFDNLLTKQNISHEIEVKELVRLRKELEGKCETYEGEMAILHTLVSEQKQQLIEAYKEHEHEMNMKMLDLQQRDEQIAELRAELRELKTTLESAGDKLSEELTKECEKLRESLKINKTLVTEQVNELSNKQETIETLNQQIIDLYKAMEENTNKVIEKEDEISYLQEVIDTNGKDLESLRKDNNEQKQVVDKLLDELHSHRANAENLPRLESELQRLQTEKIQQDAFNKELEQRNKEQLEKLKKYAANLKKRTLHCQELEAKLKEMEKGSIEIMQTKLQDESNEHLLREKIKELEIQSKEMREKLHSMTTEAMQGAELNDKLKSEVNELHSIITQKDTEIAQLQAALEISQEQISDWGDVKTSTIDNNKDYDELIKQLNEKTMSLDKAEVDMTTMQEEMLRVRESEQENLVAINEIQEMLKQKSALIEALQQQMRSADQTGETIRSLEEKTQAQDNRIREVTEELKAKSLKFEKSKAVIKERNNQIHRLQAQLKDLQDKMSSHPEEELLATPVAITKLGASTTTVPQIPKAEYDEMKKAYDMLSEKFNAEQANFQETIARLETLHDGIQAKLQENMSYIESLEQENVKFKEKICKLEEGIATFEERRASMERRTNLLCAQMQSRENEYEKAEDELIYRLNMLSEHDEVIGQRLLDTQDERNDLQERIDKMQDEFSKLSTNYRKLEEDYQKYQNEFESNLETETQSLREQLTTVKSELERSRSVYDAKLAAKTTELDEIECELSEQVSNMNKEKRALLEDLERSRDECNEQKDEVVRLKESLNALEQSKQELDREATWLRMQSENAQQDQYELQELRMQTIQDKTEIDNLRHQIDTLSNNHDMELQALRTQISELDTLRMQVGQNQTDDQVFIETENKRLTDLLAEKEVVIENYQRQNLQLQMAAATASQLQGPTQHDPLALTFSIPSVQSVHTTPSPQTILTSTAFNEERDRWQRDLNEKNELISRLQRELNTAQNEFHNVLEGNHELQRQLLTKNQEIENLRNTSSVLGVPQFTNDVIPAPPLFFAAEQPAPSPFDEIIQVRNVENLESVSRNHDNLVINNALEQPTIEDLQRNVSDLEKHAQDLENKLASRNQRELELEERLRESQNVCSELERKIRERDNEINNAQIELQNSQKETNTLRQDEIILHQNINELKCRLAQIEHELSERNRQIKEIEEKLQAQAAAAKSVADNSHTQDLVRLGQLQANLEQLQILLQQREDELSLLKRTLEGEKTLKESAKLLESQIIPNELTNLGSGATKNTVPTLDMFFGGNSSTSDFEQLIIPTVATEPVVEDVIVPEKAYICYPEGRTSKLQTQTDPAIKITALDLGGDWGDSWGAQEAAAEAEHYSKATTSTTSTKVSLVPREQRLEIELQEKVEKIQELELAIERCEQQKQEMQVKSGKLMKKLKEYKTKIEELQIGAKTQAFSKATTPESSSMFSDLDAAIQDELKAQIKSLEEKLQDLQKVNDNQILEKEKLLKRIDVLTAGSERMAEMKERQDMDVQMYQARIKELQEKLNSLDDWGTDSVAVVPQQATPENALEVSSQPTRSNWESGQSELEQRITELTAELQDSIGDKHELQALLEDEKANTARSEEMVKSLQQQLATFDLQTLANENSEKSKYNDLKLDYQNLLEKYNSLHVSNESQAAELNLLKGQEEKLQTALAEAESTLDKLRQELATLQTQYDTLQFEVLMLNTKNSELRQANEELQSTISAVPTPNANTESLSNENELLRTQNELLEKRLVEYEQERIKQQSIIGASTTNDIDDLVTQLQERESEIMHLKQRIEDLMREDQTEKLVLEILTKNQEIHLLKMQVKNLEDDKQELEHNLSVQITTEMQINKTEAENESTNQRERIEKLERQVQEMSNEKENMEEELKVLNNHVLSSLENEDKLKAAALELDAKSIEITELRKTLEVLKTSNGSNSESVPVDYVALNAQWEAIVEQKCGEIAKMWRDHLEQRETEFKLTEARLNEEIVTLRSAQPLMPARQGLSGETTATTTPASESTTASGTSSAAVSKDGTPLRQRIINEENEVEADAIIEKMQAALESQEMEIVTLKEQLAIRSAEYARLAAQYDPFKLHSTTSHSGLNAIGGGTGPASVDAVQGRRNAASGDTSVVPKSELDFALYMLHQRDMRCEEMTVELVSLLEERDTLQIKLSNTLRQVEAIKAATNYVEPPVVQMESTAVVTSTATPVQTTSSSATSADSADELSQKLSQLQTVNHSKDKVIKEERDQRIRQMEKIQQDVAKMPPAAVSELVGTDPNQTGQSPSSVLLNWLWGNKPNVGGDAPH